MNRKKVLCLAQQQKIFFYTIVIIASIILFTATNITITNQNNFTKQIIAQKKRDLEKKKVEIGNIDKTIKFIENEKININLDKKYSFFSTFNEQEFLNLISAKMNENAKEQDTDDKKFTSDYSNFSIKMRQIKNDDLKKIMQQLKQKIVINDGQKIDFSVNDNLLLIDFSADYEYTIYRILEAMKQILPGNVVVKKISVKPAKDELKKMLYTRYFEGQNDFKADLNNRLSCSIELEWIYLCTNKVIDIYGDNNKV